MDIITLHKKGLSQRKISKKLGISRNTVKKYLENPEFSERQKRRSKSLLDPYIGNIEAWLSEDIAYSGTWIYDRLTNMGFRGSYEIVKRKVHELKAERQSGETLQFYPGGILARIWFCVS